MSHTHSDDSLFANSFHLTINSLGNICMSEALLTFLLRQCLESHNSGHYCASVSILLVPMCVLLLQQSASQCCHWKLPATGTLQNSVNLVSPYSPMNLRKENI